MVKNKRIYENNKNSGGGPGICSARGTVAMSRSDRRQLSIEWGDARWGNIVNRQSLSHLTFNVGQHLDHCCNPTWLFTLLRCLSHYRYSAFHEWTVDGAAHLVVLLENDPFAGANSTTLHMCSSHDLTHIVYHTRNNVLSCRMLSLVRNELNQLN